MNRKHLTLIMLAITIFGSAGSLINPNQVIASQTAKSAVISAQNKQRPPAPPTTPPPNRTRSGGSLGGEATCASDSQDLAALIPVENPVLTTAEHPTFWFHVPYAAEQVESGEFSVLVGSTETQRLYQTKFTVPAPGVVSLSLPVQPEYALQENTPYHWYFKLQCSNGAMLQVDGWVQRVALTPERQRQIDAASPEVWYDSLNQIANGLLNNPQDSILRAQWRILLERIAMADLLQSPLVGTVQLEHSAADNSHHVFNRR